MDAAPVRAHVQDLVDRGMRQQIIADGGNVSNSAISLLLHGHYAPGRPAQQTIRADTGYRLLAVEFQAPTMRHRSAEMRCAPSARFERVGYRVGRCADCGELAPTVGGSAARGGGGRAVLVGHPTLDPTEGGEAL